VANKIKEIEKRIEDLRGRTLDEDSLVVEYIVPQVRYRSAERLSPSKARVVVRSSNGRGRVSRIPTGPSRGRKLLLFRGSMSPYR